MLDQPDVMKYYNSGSRSGGSQAAELRSQPSPFMLSNDASYVTSATLLVDAGFIVNAEL